MASRSSFQGQARRVGWMIIIWAVSVTGLGIFAMAFRFLMSLAGLTE